MQEKQQRKPVSQKDGQVSGQKMQNLMQRLNIVQFFLNLYKYQLAAEDNTKTDIVPITSESTAAKYVYELRVRRREKWESRRMTIGALGEGSGSKSTCYYAIYDVYQVIKIPPVPIKSFDDYVEYLRKDRQIVLKLAPRECIVPNVSVVMKRVHTFEDSARMSPEVLEEEYIKWLRANTRFQDHLKIGGSFVFFMDLSNYYFLSHVLDDLHDFKTKFFDEITKNYEIIWEPHGFEGRYGFSDRNAAICEGIKEAFEKCESTIRHMLVQSGASSTVLLYQIRQWFFLHIAGIFIEKNDKDLSDDFVDDLNALIQEFIKKHKKTVEAYRGTIKAYVSKVAFATKKNQIESLITNLLELLGWLGKKGVAMRDIKPDNIFVAGNPEEYPNFLRSAKEYKLGLIDVETAVVFKKKDSKQIEQPQLGGTPFFATPPQLFTNNVLDAVYHDFPRILQLQDWYATIGLIYKVATGGVLFLQTGKLYPSLSKKVLLASKKNQDMIPLLKDISKLFWRTAINEFTININKKEKLFRSLAIDVPSDAVAMFKDDITVDKKKITRAIKKCIDSQMIFKEAKDRERLLKAPHDKIVKLKLKWEKGFDLPPSRIKDRAAIVTFFTKLEELKSRLEKPRMKISVYDLLEMMFNTVLKALYLKEWGDLWKSDSDESDDDYDKTI